jgi:hypothetical protein
MNYSVLRFAWEILSAGSRQRQSQPNRQRVKAPLAPGDGEIPNSHVAFVSPGCRKRLQMDINLRCDDNVAVRAPTVKFYL